MAKCLLTQLDTIVNDSNLPVIEVMQQVTLDAITKSGNTQMTDAQKFALNHLFYALGAANNNEIWQNVTYLFLPLISATDSAALSDYKNEGIYLSNDSRFIQKAGGLRIKFNEQDSLLQTALPIGGLSSLTSLNVKNSSCIASVSDGSINGGGLLTEGTNGNYLDLGLASGNTANNATVRDADNPEQRYFYTVSLTSLKSILGASASATAISLSGCNTEGTVEHAYLRDNEYYNAAEVVSTVSSRAISFYSQRVYTAFIHIKKALTDSEMDNILLALQALENAFAE